MKRLSIFALALALTGATWVESRAQEAPAPTEDVIVDENGDGLDDGKVRRHRRGSGRRGGKGRRAGAGLTREQKTELKAAVSELKEAGATTEEIRAAIDEFRADSGLLTREQRAELKDEISGLKESGATPEEIVDAIVEFHAANGAELSEQQQTRLGERAGRAAQRQALHDEIGQLRESGATPEEIRAAVEEFAAENDI